MPALVINKQYQDGQVLSESQLDAAFASITTLINTVGLGADNLQDNSVGSAEIQTSGVTNTNLATNSVSTVKIVDANVTLSKLDPVGVAPYLVQVGVGCDYFVNTAIAPIGYLICDGSAVSRTTYANLFNVIGTLYGTGDGSATFNLPNCADRVFRQIGTYSAENAYALNTGTASMYQDDAEHDHTHRTQTSGTASGGSGGFNQNAYVGTGVTFSTSAVEAFNGTGGQPGVSSTESRMKNIQGYKIIKY